MQTRLFLHLAMPVLLLWSGSTSAQFIWVEGEDAISHTMERHNWYDSVNKEALSGGEWLSQKPVHVQRMDGSIRIPIEKTTAYTVVTR